ncbi:MAG: anti-sigma factor family protein [Pyrinomonadaceae bacterium]
MMNEQERGAGMKEKTGATPECGRTEELVAYLYGEATKDEARSFEQHLSACAACRDDLAAFGGVREAVGEWRRAAVSITPSLALDKRLAAELTAPLPGALEPPERSRSALAALREFFSLTPLWLQAGGVAAALLVCALAALTIARAEIRWDNQGIALRTGVGERTVVKTVEVPSGPSQEEVDALVAARVERELKALKDRQTQMGVVTAVSEKRPVEVRQAGGAVPRGSSRAGRSTRPGTSRREQLVENDESLPRLYDLLSEVN